MAVRERDSSRTDTSRPRLRSCETPRATLAFADFRSPRLYNAQVIGRASPALCRPLLSLGAAMKLLSCCCESPITFGEVGNKRDQAPKPLGAGTFFPGMYVVTESAQGAADCV